MKRPLSLFARALLTSFACTCIVLVSGFFVLNAAVKTTIKQGLKEDLLHTQQRLNEADAEYNQRDTQLIATLGENASLKAAVGLLREQVTSTTVSEARNTIEQQLEEMSRGLDYDLLMVTDTQGKVAALVGAGLDTSALNGTTLPGNPSLLRLGQTFYKVATVPINLGPENLGTLAVGRRFDLSAPSAFGYAVLTNHERIVSSTLPVALQDALEKQLSGRCGSHKDDCEIRIGGTSYLVLEMNAPGLGADYELSSLASIDRAMGGFTRGLWRAFVVTGLGGLLMALLLSVFASRSISRPLSELASVLEKSGETGALWTELHISWSTREVNLLAGALNHAASARRRVEGDLRRAKEAADAANRAKSEFLANVSHELRTPMNGILGLTELLLDTNLTAEQREDLGLVKFSANSLLTVVNDTLDFSKIEARKLDLDLVGFDLRETLSETLKTLSVSAHQKGLELAWEVKPSVPELFTGDPARLRQILTNLVGNAIKFTPQGWVAVRVAAEEENGSHCLLHFTVQDTGIGIPAEKHGIIFEAFSQADGSSTRRYGGTGLGLTIAARLVELMQGRIWLESEPGQGSRFHFTARLAYAEAIRT